MKLSICIAMLLVVSLVSGQQEQQRILRRVVKSTPTATNLGRIRQVTIRSASAEKGAVSEISSKEAASFGQRSFDETTTSNNSQQLLAAPGTKTKQVSSTTPAPAPTTSTSPTTTTAAATTTTTVPSVTTPKSATKHRASDRQQAVQPEVELLSSAPSSWQTMTAVEAPVAMLIATGARAQSDLSQSSSNVHEESSSSVGDVLRSSATKGAASYTQQQSGETFSRLRQQSSKQQQSFFYPQAAPLRAGKTSNQGTKTHWYSAPSTTTTTPRPAPIIQQEQQYEQQNEQYVEQQQEYSAAPLGQAEPFAFDFNTQDSKGNGQYRKEESDKNGVVRGSYGYTGADGIYRHVEYVADQNGFRANIKSNEPGLIGETQPASIQLAGGNAPASRLEARNNNDEGEFSSISNDGNNNNPGGSADLALAPPDFESSHKSDRLRAPRHFRN